ncbi:MAG: hypothetical protein WC662_04230 [Candidatus Paceibacterota bacterium]|jgi:hypothetical protein
MEKRKVFSEKPEVVFIKVDFNQEMIKRIVAEGEKKFFFFFGCDNNEDYIKEEFKRMRYLAFYEDGYIDFFYFKLKKEAVLLTEEQFYEWLK